MELDSLGDWRRTHLTREINSDLTGEKTIVMGWITDIRDLGGIKFFILQDSSGTIQVTAPERKVNEKILEKIDSISKESSVAVKGEIAEAEQAPRGVEVIPSEIKVLNPAETPLPLDPTGRVKADLDTRLDSRLLDLRRPTSQAIFNIKHGAIKVIRDYMISNGFIEVQTPKIVGSATESGATLFPISYFDREAFLSQSPQLYKEVLTGCFEKVFEVGPIYRAEEHDTRYHLNEVISADIEVAFSTKEDVMDILEEAILNVFKEISKDYKGELKRLEHELKTPKKPIPRITYDEALDKLNNAGMNLKWGDDFSIPEQRKLGEVIGKLYFITDWPSSTKPFYIMPHEDDPDLSHAFDLLYNEIELVSGGTRVHQKDLLEKQLRDKGMNPTRFRYHLKNFEWGIPPHAGWGLGIERLTMALTGVKNIRETVLFPRDRKRLTP